MICIVASSRKEVKFILGKINITENTISETYETIIGNINNKHILLLITGYGKIKTAVALARTTIKYDVTEVIVVGNCGVVLEINNMLSAVAISNSVIVFDNNLEALGVKKAQINPNQNIQFIASNALINSARCSVNYLNFQGYIGLFASSDTFVANANLANDLIETFNADFVDIESAAAADFCSSYNIPFVSVKGISNFARGSAAKEFFENEDAANELSCQVVLGMI